jgi:hypothetical protein
MLDPHSLKILLGSFADQQYQFSLLIKILEEKNILQKGEFLKQYSEKDRYQFSHDLLEELVSRGLKIDESLPSALPQEPPSASQAVAKEAIDPATESKS